jgi:hypothetical protein
MDTNNKRKSINGHGDMKGGGCGCGVGHGGSSTMTHMFKGGSSCIATNPNPPSFNNVPLHSFYPQANQNENPLNNQIASRLVGGRKKGKKNKSQKKQNKSGDKSQKKQNKREGKGKSQKKRRGGGIFMNNSPEFTLLPTNTMA